MMIRAALLLFAFTLLISFPTDAQNAPHIPGAFLVSFVEGTDPLAFASRMPASTSPKKVSDLLNIWLLRSTESELGMLDWLRRQPEVRFAQFNHLLENRAEPNDPLFPQQWHLRNLGLNGGLSGADLNAVPAWDIATGGLTPAGDTIVMAVIDGGVDAFHADLAPNLWHNWDEIPNNGLDDDQNGYTDDFRGWNVFSENDAIDGNNNSHGTPVSAMLGARGNNNLGVTGVNWNTQVMFVAATAFEASILSAYDYVFKARKQYNESWGEKGAFIVSVNCSWGINYGQPSEAPLWCEAFDQLGEIGIVSVAATANLGLNVDEVGDLPTACPSKYLLSVTSLNSSDQKAENAAWGAQNIDLGAYGQEVFTAAAGGGYGYFAGTSFAAPQVTGAVALLYAAPCPNLIALAKTDPGAAAYWAKSLILENVTQNATLDGKTYSNGRLNLYQTLNTYQGQCSDCPAPFALKTETLTDSSVLLNWSRPPSALYVNLRWRAVGSIEWHKIPALTDAGQLGNLDGCASYEVELQSICEGGVLSAWSPPFVFETKGCCTIPASVWVENIGNDFAVLAWEPSAYNNEYRLRLREANVGAWAIYEAVGNHYEFPGLNLCADYEFQVQARCEDWLTDFSPIFNFKTKGCGSCNEVEYCMVKAEDATEEWIAGVQIESWLHSSGPGGNGYQNFSNTQTTYPHLAAFKPVWVSLHPGFAGAVTKEYYRIYVDFNQDGDFNDDYELAFDPGFALEGPAEGYIQVPELTKFGITRLRIMMKYTAPGDPPPTACSNFSFGQVEDYCVELLPGSVGTSSPSQLDNQLLCVYPSPAKDWAWVVRPEESSDQPLELVVLDVTGRYVLVNQAPILLEGRLFLDIQDWSAGVYAIQLRCGAKLWVGKLIKG